MASERDVRTELYVGAWTDVSTLVRVADAVTVVRGRPNEAAVPPPSRAALTIDNESGDFNPRNPTGQYYGSLGRNTPLRLAVRVVTDDFGTPVSGGWGTTDTGQDWSWTGAGGTLQASDFNVAAGVGTHSVPATSAYRLTLLQDVVHRDVEVAVTVTLPFSNVTGGDLEPVNVLLRGQSVTDYYMVRVVITTAEAVTIAVMHYDGTVITGAVTVPGLTHSSSQALRVRAQAEGHTVRAKIWAASGSEPYGWHVTGHTERITTAGWVGVRSGVASGNTNTKPIVFSYDDWEVRIPRFAGEVASWPQKWDLSGNDRYTPIEAAGVRRRLGQGASPLQSSLRRGLLATSGVVAYWPMEDPAGSTRLASALPGGAEMVITRGAPDLASSTDFEASEPIPVMKTAHMQGIVPVHTAGRTQVRFLLSVPAAGIATDSTIITVGLTGTIAYLVAVVSNTGALKLRAVNRSGTDVHDSGYFAYDVNGSPRWVSLEFEQVGANVEVNLVTLEPGAASGSQIPGPGDTIASQTAGIVRFVQINAIQDAAAGHVSVHNIWSSLFNLGSELNAWKGETAGARIQRLCGEENIAFSHVGTLSDTATMGAQQPAALGELLDECAAADLGTLYEPRGEVGLTYRTRTSVYDQAATVALDYAAAQISAPFEPTDDDQVTRNDVTATRVGGSSARAVLETGAMSVLPPDQGGIGRYDESVEVNVETDGQLPDIAGWLVHLGTVDEARYPVVTLDLTTPGITAAGLEPAILDLDVDDRLTITNPPPGQPPDDISQLVRGYTETIRLFQHRLELNCAPESPWQIIVLDGTEVRADSDASTLAAGVTSTATTLSVAVSDGTLWTTDGGEMPIPIMVGGEEMSVTAITGGSSPQSFTVTRSVTGVVKAHSAGAQVRLVRRAVLPL